MDPTRPINRDGVIYQQIADYLRDDIVRGIYPDGARLPSEAQLNETYGVTDRTARAAIRLLADEGRARVVQGKGAYAVNPPRAA